MEEFEHMIVGEFNEEDFYETIEAPKFVDLTAPDHRPEGDDRYWFCSRVGCDQKHEEFMDSEAIYKKFVLRVMAARSPNVRLRKALYRKDFSVDPKCPNTVPAKPSRSRFSRLAMISSIPPKANCNIRSKEVKVISTNKNATPKSKVKGKDLSAISSVPQKALTDRKKQMQSPAAFRSVQNPRSETTKLSQTRVVAKALVFNSPKKLVKLKRSVELSSSVKKLVKLKRSVELNSSVKKLVKLKRSVELRSSVKKFVKLKRSVELRSSVKKLCNGMRKLEIENKRKGLGVNQKVETSVPSKRPLKTREVKSRVFDSVRSQKQVDEKAKRSGTLKQRVKEKEEHVLSSDPFKAHEANAMELENQSLCCASSLPRSEKAIGDEYLIENKSEELSNTLKTNTDDQFQAREDPAVMKDSGLDTSRQYQIAEIEDKENATMAAEVNREDISVVKESGVEKSKQYETTETEDKENASAMEECDDKENATNAAGVDRESDDKENSSCLDSNRKVDKATYPMLKRKVFCKKETCKTTQKAMTTADKYSNGKTVSDNTRVKYTKPKLTNPKPFRLRTDERRILKEANTEKKPQCALTKEEETTDIVGFHVENMGPKHEPVRLETNTTSRLKDFRGASITPVRHDASGDMVNCKRVALGTKKQVASKRTETIEKTTSVMNGKSKEVAIINKRSVCTVASGEKRPATVPKGPNFHTIHVPKSCTKRVESHV